MTISSDSIADHIIEHEILGVTASTGAVGVTVSGLQTSDGILWFEDETRSKWLSVSRVTFGAGTAGRAKNRYLSAWDGLEIGVSGYRLPRDATLTAIAAQTRGSFSWTVRIRKNDNSSDIASLAISSASGGHNGSLDIDFTEGDRLQIFAETSNLLGVRDPVVWLELAWRNDSL